MSTYTRIAAGALLGAVTLAACSSSRTATPSTKAQTTPATGPGTVLQQDFVNVVNKVLPSVVEISTNADLGSGIVYDTQGDIVTNNHVVGTATQFQVTYSDGQTVTGTLVGTFAPDDLAVIKAPKPSGISPATFADSTTVGVGDIVLAMGNPLGLSSSVTQGIVSFNGRTVSEGNLVILPSTIQTSASINPGNSGGALVNLASQVVGIPTLAATDPQLGGGSAPGIGFAIPSNTVKLIAGQLVSQGKVTNSDRASLGITGANDLNSGGQPIGVIVRSAQAGGAANSAGILPGYVVVQVNGQPTPKLSVLAEVLAGLQPGAKTSVTVMLPGGTQKTFQVTLGTL
jgi:S1-C subfamily serine protease